MTGPAYTPLALVKAAELGPLLERALSVHFSRPCRVCILYRQASAQRSSFALEEWDVTLDDGSRLPLVVKDLSWHALSEAGQYAKPAALHDPLREIVTYREILSLHRLGTAVCYGAVVDPARGRYWLFLERVVGRELYAVGEFFLWADAARWLAAMHARFAPNVGLLRATHGTHMIRCDAAFYHRGLRRAQANMDLVGGGRRAAFKKVLRRYDSVIERLLTLPATFIHGECFASNILVQRQEGGWRICPVDWEMAAVGPGLLDLAALTAGSWREEEQESLARAYRAAHTPPSEWTTKPDAFDRALTCCRLHLAVQELGRPAEWSPPAEHAHDWLDDAVRLAENLL